MVSPQIIDISTVMSRINRSSEVRRGFFPALPDSPYFPTATIMSGVTPAGSFKAPATWASTKAPTVAYVKPERFGLQQHILICRSGIHKHVLHATVSVPRR